MVRPTEKFRAKQSSRPGVPDSIRTGPEGQWVQSDVQTDPATI